MNQTRIILYCLILTPIVYDVLCLLFGWTTITAAVRDANYESGQLIMLGWIALLVHFFIVPLVPAWR